MKHTLILLAALFLAPLASLQGAQSLEARIVIVSAAGTKLDSDVIKGGFYNDPIAYPSAGSFQLDLKSVQVH